MYAVKALPCPMWRGFAWKVRRRSAVTKCPLLPSSRLPGRKSQCQMFWTSHLQKGPPGFHFSSQSPSLIWIAAEQVSLATVVMFWNAIMKEPPSSTTFGSISHAGWLPSSWTSFAARYSTSFQSSAWTLPCFRPAAWVTCRESTCFHCHYLKHLEPFPDPDHWCPQLCSSSESRWA